MEAVNDQSPRRSSADDPVLVRRERVKRAVSLGQRTGYGLYAIACVAFVAGFRVGFGGWVTVVVTAGLVVGSAVLAPAIVFGYAARAADRADRDGTW
jgi:hypothetical protein